MKGAPFGTPTSAFYAASAAMWRDRIPTRETLLTLEERQRARAARTDMAAARELIRAYQAGEPKAAPILLFSFTPMVAWQIKRMGRLAFLNFEDCLQEGRIGLLEGVSRFDLSTPYAPSTYLTHYIRCHVRRSIESHGELVRMPTHLWNNAAGKKKRRRSMNRRLVVTFTEIAESWSDDFQYAYEDLIADENIAMTDVVLGDTEVERTMPVLVEWIFEQIGPRDAYVLRKRLLEGLTLREIGDLESHSRELIRQVEERGLEKAANACRLLKARPDNFRTFEEWVAAACSAVRTLRAMEALDRESAPEPPPSGVKLAKTRAVEGEVYFVQADGGPIKIGFTTRGMARIQELQVGSAATLVILGAVRSTSVRERQLHKQFRKHHIRGEWFRPSKSLLNYIENVVRRRSLEAA